jgi:hypothetical protein
VGNRKWTDKNNRKAELAIKRKKGKNLQHMGYEKNFKKDGKRELLDLKREEVTARSSRNKLVVPEVKNI